MRAVLGLRRGRGRIRVAPKAERQFKGRTMASKAEKRYAEHLELLKKAGEILRYTMQPSFPLRSIDGHEVCKYVADFEVEYPDRLEVHEVKGMETAVWRLKEKWFRADYPHIPLIVIDAKTLKVRRDS